MPNVMHGTQAMRRNTLKHGIFELN